MAEQGTEPTSQEEEEIQERTFTQEELDKIVQERLSRQSKQVKEGQAAIQKLQELEEAEKTEQQKLQDKLAEAESRIADFEKRDEIASIKSEVAQAQEVPVELLRGSSQEEIEAHAAQLKKYLEKPSAPVVPNEGKHSDAQPQGDWLREKLQR